jgi:CheY-like chemotaxis protein/two-component sensor histidine kinase
MEENLHGHDQDPREQQIYIGQKLEIIGQLAGGISHNFNNQLTGIMGFANLIRMRAANDNIKRFAEEILNICKTSGDMVRELLTFARNKPVSAAHISAHNVIKKITELLSSGIDKRIEVKSEFKSERDLVTADPVQFQSAFLNLALNSCDAMPTGGTVKFSTEYMGSEFGSGIIKIVVSDTGSGFSAEAKAHLFEPFFTTKAHGHAGLGLAAVYRFVKAMNGAIDVNSAEGEGTEVTILLPLLNVETGTADSGAIDIGAAAAKSAANKNTANTGNAGNSASVDNSDGQKSNGTILLADDDDGVRGSLAAFLKSAGYDVVTAVDGLDAVEKYGSAWASINLVIIDMVMPRLDGKEAFIKMKEVNPLVKAVGITGYTTHSGEELMAVGMKRLLTKPFAFDELSRVVAEYI